MDLEWIEDRAESHPFQYRAPSGRVARHIANQTSANLEDHSEANVIEIREDAAIPRRKPKDDSRFAFEVGMAEVIRGSILKFLSAG
jgi:hypothetical protein